MRALLTASVLATLVGAPAWAQMDSREGIALQNQLLELRRDVQALQSQRGGGYAPVPVAPRGGGGEIGAQLLDRVATLEEAMRQLRGQLDEQANASRRREEELAKQVADLNFRLQGGGGAGPAPVSGGPPPPPNPPATGGTGRRPPELAMQEGNAALARRDYPMAEASAREVLANGRGPRATDAQFLLAQALSGRRDYQGAAVAYDDAYNRARTGSRAPDALLGLAGAMMGLGDRGAACEALGRLRAEFATVRPDVRDGIIAVRTRAGCR